MECSINNLATTLLKTFQCMASTNASVSSSKNDLKKLG